MKNFPPSSLFIRIYGEKERERERERVGKVIRHSYPRLVGELTHNATHTSALLISLFAFRKKDENNNNNNNNNEKNSTRRAFVVHKYRVVSQAIIFCSTALLSINYSDHFNLVFRNLFLSRRQTILQIVTCIIIIRTVVNSFSRNLAREQSFIT